MSIIKKRQIRFVQVSNELARDCDISFKAKGLFMYMASMAEGWNFTIKSIAKQQKDGEASVISALKELKSKGYLTYQKYSNGTGAYYLNDCPSIPLNEEENEAFSGLEPKVENPNLENHNLEKAKLGKPPRIKNTIPTKNTIEKNTERKKEEAIKETAKPRAAMPTQSAVLSPSSIIKFYKENISDDYANIREQNSFNAISMRGYDMEKIMIGLQNYAKVLEVSKRKPEPLFFFVRDSLYLNHQVVKEVVLGKNEIVVPKDLVGKAYIVEGKKIKFENNGYFLIDKDYTVTNAQNVQDMINLVRGV